VPHLSTAQPRLAGSPAAASAGAAPADGPVPRGL